MSKDALKRNFQEERISGKRKVIPEGKPETEERMASK